MPCCRASILSILSFRYFLCATSWSFFRLFLLFLPLFFLFFACSSLFFFIAFFFWKNGYSYFASSFQIPFEFFVPFHQYICFAKSGFVLFIVFSDAKALFEDILIIFTTETFFSIHFFKIDGSHSFFLYLWYNLCF